VSAERLDLRAVVYLLAADEGVQLSV